MPKQPSPVVLNEHDLISLTNLLESGDSDLAKRANVIIECSKGLNNIEVAQNVGMNRMRVAHWRNAFLENGISGLISKHGGGASPAAPVEDFNAKIDKLLEDRNTAWTAEALAQETGASLNMVYYALRKRGIHLQRQRRWIIPTQDEIIPKTLDIAGLYISKKEQAMLVCCSSSPILCSKGELITRCKELSDDFAACEGRTISLSVAINTAIERVYTTSQQKDVPLTEFLSETMALLPSDSCYEYHLFICSPDPRPYRGDKIRNVFQVRPADSSQWLDTVSQKINELCDRSQLNSTSSLFHAIRSYLQKSTDVSSPLTWRKILNNEDNRASIDTGTEKKPDSDTFLKKLSTFLKDNLVPSDIDDSSLRVGFISFVYNKDEIMVALDENQKDSLNTQQLQLATKENYEETLTTLESEILKIRNIAGKHEIEMTVELLKKNNMAG